MTATDLLDLVSNGESSGVEFQRDTLDPRSLAKELVALSNFDGGRVLLGVEDDGSISGITRPDLEQWVMNVCRDKIRPEIIPYFELVQHVQGKTVAVLRVERGFNVHHVWHDQHRTYYIRVGTQSREASPEELARLFQQRGSIRSELQPITGTSIRNLDLRRLKDYFQNIRQQDSPAVDDEPAWIPLLTNIEVLLEREELRPCTAAGLLLFGLHPNRFLPQAGIDAAVYSGTEKGYHAVERISIRGPMVRLGESEDGLWETTRDFLQRHISHEHLDEKDRRTRRWDVPSDVMREAIINALVHRDYLLSGTTIELSIYSDRIEVISPGRLPNGITPARMRTGCRAARNQLIKDTMLDYGYMEHMGMGVPRKIIRGMHLHNGTEPELVSIPDNEQFVLKLSRLPAPPADPHSR